MKLELPAGTGGRRTLALLAGLAGLKAAGMILLAGALATGIATLAGGGTPDVRRLLWEGCAGVLLRAAAVWATELAAQRAGLGAKESLRARLVDSALRRPGAAGRDADAADGPSDAPRGHGAVSALASRGLDGLDSYYTRYLPALVAAAVVPVAVLIRLLFADWVSALIVALTLPLVPVFMILIGLHTQDRVALAARGLDRLANQLMELAQGLPALIGLRRGRAHGEALGRVSEAHRKTTMGTLRTAFVSGMALELIATLSVALVAVFIGLRLVHGTMALEVGLFALMLSPECYLPLRALGAAFHSSEDGLEALRRARALMADGAPTGAADSPAGFGQGPGPAVLRVEDLDVHYPGRAIPAVSGFSLDLAPGRAHVLDGPSGSGKTSILGAVGGRLGGTDDGAAPRVSGRIDVDRDAVAWVPQHPEFTEDTVEAELLLHASDSVEASDLEAVLLAVNAAPLLRRRLVDCSPGELRRVAVARALVRVRTDAAVRLVLADEPTAHLDPLSADAVRGALAGLRGRAALLVASHDVRLAAMLRGHGREAAAEPDENAASGAGVPDRTAATGASAKPAAVPDDAEISTRPMAAPGAAAGHRGRDLPIRSGRRHWALLRTLPWGRGGMARGLLFAVLASLAAIGLTGVSGWLIVNASHMPPVLHLMVAIVGVRTFGIGRAVLRYAERLAVHNAVLRWAGILRTRVWEALSTRPENWGRITRTGAALGHLVAEVDEVRDAVPRVLVPPVAGILTWAAVSVGIGVWAPDGLPAALALGGAAFVLLPLVVLAVERSSSVAVVRHRLWLSERIPTLLAAASDLAGNGAAGRAADRFADEDALAASAVRRAAWGSGAGQAGAVLLAGLGSLTAVAAVAAGGGTGEAAAVAGLLLLALAEPVAETASSVQGIPALDDGLRRINASLGHEEAGSGVGHGAGAVPALPPARATGAGVPAGPVALRLDNVHLGWGSGATVVQGVSAEIVPGEWLAVTGPSGSGKSTALASLLGALAPRSGRLDARTGGSPWHPAGPEDFARVAWCPQEAHLFDATVRNNLCLGREANDLPADAELRGLLARVGLGAWLDGAVDGLDTRIGSGGHRLSGGQRQRLAVARALVARADVVLLDEPTAHLGADESLALIADLRAALAGQAVVVVTHDARLEPFADSVLRLGGGMRRRATPADGLAAAARG